MDTSYEAYKKYVEEQRKHKRPYDKEDLLAGGFTEEQIASYEAQNLPEGEEAVPTGEVDKYSPTMRQNLASNIAEGFKSLGLDEQNSREVAELISGRENPTDGSWGMGLADFSPLGIPMGIQEGSRQIERGYNSDSAMDMSLGALNAGLSVVEAIPGGKLVGKAISKTANKMADSYDPSIMYSFFGPTSKSADLDALNKAKRLEARGLTKDEIWKQTGWWNAPEQGWVFEVDDSKLSVPAKGKARNEDLISHPEGWEALRPNSTLTDKEFIDRDLEALKAAGATGVSTKAEYAPDGEYGHFVPGSKNINLFLDDTAENVDLRKKTAVHEFQHLVDEVMDVPGKGVSHKSLQNIIDLGADNLSRDQKIIAKLSMRKGFEESKLKHYSLMREELEAKKSELSEFEYNNFLTFIDEETKELKAGIEHKNIYINKMLEGLKGPQKIKTMVKDFELLGAATQDGIKKEEGYFSSRFIEADSPFENDWDVGNFKLAENPMHSLYERELGEARARLAGKRANYSAEDRKNIFPEEDYDVPLDQMFEVEGLEGLFKAASGNDVLNLGQWALPNDIATSVRSPMWKKKDTLPEVKKDSATESPEDIFFPGIEFADNKPVYNDLKWRSGILEIVEDMEFPNQGMKGSQLIKEWQDNPDIKNSELKALDLDIDPQKRYTKEEVKELLDKSIYEVSGNSHYKYSGQQRQKIEAPAWFDKNGRSYGEISITGDNRKREKGFSGYSHFEDNSMAHARYSTYESKTPDKRPYMVIEELQSDWLQNNRKGMPAPIAKTEEGVELGIQSLIARADELGIDKIVLPNLKRIVDLRYKKPKHKAAALDENSGFSSTYIKNFTKVLDKLDKQFPGLITRSDISLPYDISNDIDWYVSLRSGNFDSLYYTGLTDRDSFLKSSKKASDSGKNILETIFEKEGSNDIIYLLDDFFHYPARQPVNENKFKEFVSEYPVMRKFEKLILDSGWNDKHFVKRISKLSEAGIDIEDSVYAYVGSIVKEFDKVDLLPDDAIEIDISKLRKEGYDLHKPRFAKGGVVEKEQIDPVSGNPVPIGAKPEEVRDDIDAKLSEGEYVIPADVVRYLGLDKIENLVNKAKEGLKQMESDGRIGGEMPSETEDDLPFSTEELQFEEDPMEMSVGGLVQEEEETPLWMLPQTQTKTPAPEGRKGNVDAPLTGLAQSVDKWSPENFSTYADNLGNVGNRVIETGIGKLIPFGGLALEARQKYLNKKVPEALDTMISTGKDLSGNALSPEQMDSLKTAQTTLTERGDYTTGIKGIVQDVGKELKGLISKKEKPAVKTEKEAPAKTKEKDKDEEKEKSYRKGGLIRR